MTAHYFSIQKLYVGQSPQLKHLKFIVLYRQQLTYRPEKAMGVSLLPGWHQCLQQPEQRLLPNRQSPDGRLCHLPYSRRANQLAVGHQWLHCPCWMSGLCTQESGERWMPAFPETPGHRCIYKYSVSASVSILCTRHNPRANKNMNIPCTMTKLLFFLSWEFNFLLEKVFISFLLKLLFNGGGDHFLPY